MSVTHCSLVGQCTNNLLLGQDLSHVATNEKKLLFFLPVVFFISFSAVLPLSLCDDKGVPCEALSTTRVSFVFQFAVCGLHLFPQRDSHSADVAAMSCVQCSCQRFLVCTLFFCVVMLSSERRDMLHVPVELNATDCVLTWPSFLFHFTILMWMGQARFSG